MKSRAVIVRQGPLPRGEPGNGTRTRVQGGKPMIATRPFVTAFLAAALLACCPLLHADSAVVPAAAADDPAADAVILPVSTTPDGDLTLPAAIDIGRHIAKVARLVNPSVVHIQSVRVGRNGGSVEETGSGVIMQLSGHEGQFVVTNHHVISSAKLNDIQIRLNDGRLARPTGKLEDPETDVCVLTLREADLRPAQWGNSDALDIGH